MATFLSGGRASAIALAVALAMPTYAGTVVETATFTGTTNYTTTLNVDPFDTSLGTLTNVTIFLKGTFSGSAAAESLDSAPSTVTLNLGVLEAAVGPNPSNPLSVSASASDSRSFSASAFDGTIDFGGTSGATFTDLMAMGTGTVSSSNGAILDLFKSPNIVDFKITATAFTSQTGPGNLATLFGTEARTDLKVTYTFRENEVPAPAILGLLGAGLLGVGLSGRRRLAA